MDTEGLVQDLPNSSCIGQHPWEQNLCASQSGIGNKGLSTRMRWYTLNEARDRVLKEAVKNHKHLVSSCPARPGSTLPNSNAGQAALMASLGGMSTAASKQLPEGLWVTVGEDGSLSTSVLMRQATEAWLPTVSLITVSLIVGRL